jgi:hypothetical protein
LLLGRIGYGAAMKLSLKPHPESRRSAVSTIEVGISHPSPGTVALNYVAAGAIRDLAAPPPGAIERADELWRHTCFEAFLQPVGSGPYVEFNFAPSRRWAAYRFETWRRGMRPLDSLPTPEIEVNRSPDAFRLDAQVRVGGISLLPGDAPWRVALTAIIETLDGDKTYWSLAHPQGKPDFHHADNFALTLPAETP